MTARMSQVAAQLPAGTEPANLSSATTRLAEVYEFAIEGDLPLTELREIAEWQVRYNLLTVPGVAEVLNMGGYMRQYRVTIDPDKLRAYKVRLADIEDAVQSGNENAAGGFISTGPTEYTVRGIGRFDSVDDIKNAVVGECGGVAVYRGGVADVVVGTGSGRGMAGEDGRETVVALVIKQPDADTVKVVEGIEAAMDDMRSTLPKGVRLTPYYDQTRLIKHSLTSVTRAILVGAA